MSRQQFNEFSEMNAVRHNCRKPKQSAQNKVTLFLSALNFKKASSLFDEEKLLFLRCYQVKKNKRQVNSLR